MRNITTILLHANIPVEAIRSIHNTVRMMAAVERIRNITTTQCTLWLWLILLQLWLIRLQLWLIRLQL